MGNVKINKSFTKNASADAFGLSIPGDGRPARREYLRSRAGSQLQEGIASPTRPLDT
jgi:hypothetical protein